MFIDRAEELDALSSAWRSNQAEFAVVWGRRRVGKTRLLQEFCQRECGDRVVFWMADLASDTQLRAAFSHTIYAALPSGQPIPDAPFRTWESAFRFVGQMAVEKPLCVVIDEYPYLTQSDSSVSSVLKRLWDMELSHTKLKLIVCGSHVGMMEREILSGQAPLFGRRTVNLHVWPLPPSTVKLFLKNHSPVERVEWHAIFGGIPKYLLACDPGETPLDSAVRLLVSPTGAFYDEPLYLFREELSDPRNYLAIVRAVAGGNTIHNQIVQATGLDRGLVSRNLDTLQRLGFIGRRTPVTEANPERTRKSLYYLADPIVRFWYRFVAPNKQRIEGHEIKRVTDQVRSGLADYVSPVFEALCRAYVIAHADTLVGPDAAADLRVGAWWSSQSEIDVVALSDQARIALSGECKWSVSPVGENVLDDLKGRSAMIGLGPDTRMGYALFSRSGFTPALQRRARSEDVHLVSLDDVAAAGMI